MQEADTLDVTQNGDISLPSGKMLIGGNWVESQSG